MYNAKPPLSNLLPNGILISEKRIKPSLVIRIKLRAHLGKGQLLVDEVGSGLTTTILLKYDL